MSCIFSSLSVTLGVVTGVVTEVALLIGAGPSADL